MKARIQRGQPQEDCWICYLPTGRGIGPMGFGNTPVEAYENWHFDLMNDIAPHLDPVDYSEARRLFAE